MIPVLQPWQLIVFALAGFLVFFAIGTLSKKSK